MSAYMASLISTLYQNTGYLDDRTSLEDLKPKIQEWLGLAFYLGTDFFAVAMMSQVIQIPARNRIYHKEKQ